MSPAGEPRTQTSRKLTVGIPVFNERYAIVQAIASVINQTWTGEYEILVVDDGSTDGTREVLEELSRKIKQLRIVLHDKNKGRPAARSTLAREARGEFFAMLDADDEWYPDKLERQFALFDQLASRHPGQAESVMICGNLHHVDCDAGTERIKNFAEAYGESYGLARVLRGDNTPISQLALMRTSFLRQIGDFDPVLARAQDWDFLIRFFDAGGRIVFVPDKPLALFNFRRGGRDSNQIRACMNSVIDKYQSLYDASGLDSETVKASLFKYVSSFDPATTSAPQG